MSLDHELRGEPESLERPLAQPSLSERAVAWIEWIGIARLVTAAISVVLVCGGVFWLTRNPPPPTEASLPMASSPLTTVLDPVSSTVPPVSNAADPTELLVHVMGAVREPGVYRLELGDRVGDAVAAAGGATVDAEVDRLNLAAPVYDGDRVHVPVLGDELEANELVVGAPPGSVGTADDGEVGLIDVNRASVDMLEQLPGVGPATASAIVTERERGGPFVSLADLERVPGIGPAKVAALEGYVVT